MTADTSQSASMMSHCVQARYRTPRPQYAVVADGRVVGLVSIGDLVKAVIEEQQYELDQLQRYITS